jgi:tRNA:m4X modification enzyme
MTVPQSTLSSLAKASEPVAPPDPSSCHFFVTRKKRFCKLKPGKGKRFCGEHLGQSEKTVSDEISKVDQAEPFIPTRIPCPFDPHQ